MAKPPKKTSTSGAAPGNPDLDVLRQLVALLDSSSATTIKLGRGEVMTSRPDDVATSVVPLTPRLAGAGVISMASVVAGSGSLFGPR